MSDTSDISTFLSAQIADPDTQWSLGTFGAIAEFSRDPDEAARVAGDSLSVVTSRGGIRIEAHRDLRLIAFETTTKTGWSQRVALCLPEPSAAMGRRSVLTELGPDTAALREQDRDATLFDLGLNALQADICVRISDLRVVAQLREHGGEPIFAADNPAMGLILAHNPHRVFTSRAGRVEVYQPIPPHDGQSPEGPHTHVLPGLLKSGRSHAATEPIPPGFVPCAHLYPAHPARDAMGHAIDFDSHRHRTFQKVLERYGDPAQVAIKQRVRDAVAAGKDPTAVAPVQGRFGRTNIRVALRQIEAENAAAPSLASWLTAYEHARDHDDADHHEHR